MRKKPRYKMTTRFIPNAPVPHRSPTDGWCGTVRGFLPCRQAGAHPISVEALTIKSRSFTYAFILGFARLGSYTAFTLWLSCNGVNSGENPQRPLVAIDI